MARSSKPSRLPAARYELVLTAGGGAELLEIATGRLTWSANEDAEFRADYPGFLGYDDTADILDYLEAVGELSQFDADHCEIAEESLEGSLLDGMLRDITQL